MAGQGKGWDRAGKEGGKTQQQSKGMKRTRTGRAVRQPDGKVTVPTKGKGAGYRSTRRQST